MSKKRKERKKQMIIKANLAKIDKIYLKYLAKYCEILPPGTDEMLRCKILFLSDEDPKEALHKYTEDYLDESKIFASCVGRYFDTTTEAEEAIREYYQEKGLSLSEDEIVYEYIRLNPYECIYDIREGQLFLDSLQLSWTKHWRAPKNQIMNLSRNFSCYGYYTKEDGLVLKKSYNRLTTEWEN